MAFQRSSSDHRLALNLSVLSLDAGPNQFRVCDPDATLVASISLVQDDPFTHAIVWEQIGGDPVVWITPTNILTVSYTSINADDKRFRVTADKGTPFAVSDEISVFGAPLSVVPASIEQASITDHVCRHVTLSSSPVATSIGFIQQTTSLQLDWTLPCDIEMLVEYFVQRKPALGPWITFDVVAGGSPRISQTPNVTDNFRVLAVYSDQGQYDSNIIYTPDPGLSGVMISTVPTESTTAALVSAYTVDILTLTSKQATTSMKTSTTNRTSVSLYTVDELTLISKTVSFNMSVDVSYAVSVPSYVVDDLTGIDIGG